MQRPVFGLKWLQKLLETHTHLVLDALSSNEEDEFDLLDWIEGSDDEDYYDDDDDEY